MKTIYYFLFGLCVSLSACDRGEPFSTETSVVNETSHKVLMEILYSDNTVAEILLAPHETWNRVRTSDHNRPGMYYRLEDSIRLTFNDTLSFVFVEDSCHSSSMNSPYNQQNIACTEYWEVENVSDVYLLIQARITEETYDFVNQ